MVQWLRLQASYARAVGSIPGQETKIPPAFLVSIHLLLHSFSCCVNLLHHLAFLVSLSLKWLPHRVVTGLNGIMCLYQKVPKSKT